MLIELRKPKKLVSLPSRKRVWLYECPNGHQVRINAGSFVGKNPVPAKGAIECPQCRASERVSYDTNA